MQLLDEIVKPLSEGAELELAEDVFHRGRVKAADFRLGQVKAQLQVGADARQVLAEVGVLSPGSQCSAALL